MITTILNLIIAVCIVGIIIAVIMYIVDHVRARYADPDRIYTSQKKSKSDSVFASHHQSHPQPKTRTALSQASQPDILALKGALDTHIVANDHLKRGLILCLLSHGHILIVGDPGTGKTALTRIRSDIIGCPHSRIQWTSDLMPADLIWSPIYDRTTATLINHRWPLRNHIVIVDELNRLSPKTQSALLQYMQESSLTIDQQTITIDQPTMLIGTINDHEHLGTYGLPGSLVDRFVLILSSDTLDTNQQIAMLQHTTTQDHHPLANPQTIIDRQSQVTQVQISDEMMHHFVTQIKKLDTHYPISSRTIQSVYRMIQARAWITGSPDIQDQHISDILWLMRMNYSLT